MVWFGWADRDRRSAKSRIAHKGTEVLCDVARMLQTSGSDSGADLKLAAAQRLLQDPRLPESVRVDEKWEVQNFEMVADMSIADIVDEVCLNLGEALDMWSPRRLNTTAKSTDECVTALANHILWWGQSLLGLFGGILHDDPEAERVLDGGTGAEMGDTPPRRAGRLRRPQAEH